MQAQGNLMKNRRLLFFREGKLSGVFRNKSLCGWRIAILLVVLSGTTFAQPDQLLNKEIVFDHPPQSLGLSQRSIHCITQDKEGFLWMASWSGLIKYDGYSTRIFQADNQSPHKLKSNKILTIAEDKQGLLWIGTHVGGLYSYDKHTDRFTQYTFEQDNPYSLSNNNVWSIVQGDDGQMWIGTENGLNQFDPETGRFIRYYSDPEDSTTLTDNFITDLYIDQLGRLWGSTENGVNQITIHGDRIDVRRYYYTKDERYADLHNYVYKIGSIANNGDVSLFWSTKKGLKRLKDGVATSYEYTDRPASFSFFRTLHVVEGDEPYVLTGSEMGLNIFDPGQEKFVRFYGNFDKRTNLSHNTVHSIFIDRAGVLWVGAKKGLNKFNTYNKNFELYLTSDFDNTKSIITGIQGGAGDHYWISTIGGGLYKFQRETQASAKLKPSSFMRFKIDPQPENDFSDFVQTLHSDAKGNVWIGAAGGGVYHFNETHPLNASGTIGKYSQYSLSANGRLSDDYVMSIAKANGGGVWVGTWSGGLNKISENGGVTIFDSAILKKAPLVALYQDKEGVLWIGSRGAGFFKAIVKNERLDITVYQSGKDKKSLSNNFINTIYEDHAGSLWIGSEGGLDLFDRRTETFTSHAFLDGSNNDVVVGILEDEKGALWLSHWNGLTQFDPLSENLLLNNYDVSDRLQGGFFYNNVCFKDEEGNLFFGGSNGFNVINPENINRNPFPPRATIKNFEIFGKPVQVNKSFNGRVILDKSLDSISEIKLRHSENSISFELASIHFAAPEKNKFSYILEGFETNWQNIDANRRYINYTNLPPGSYTLRVKASNNDGVWTETDKTLHITIGAPWWKTELAIAAYAAIFVLILLIFRQLIIVRTNFINRIKIERISRENTENLNKAKLQFFTNISHEFRTPLTLIQGPLEKILNAGEGSRFVKEQLGIINRNTQTLLRLVNQLMDFRKIEAGNIKLKVAEGNIVKFIKEIKLSFEGLAEQMEVEFNFHATSNVIKAWYDRDQFEKVLFNLLSNSFKHVGKKGKIDLSLFETEDHIALIIEDNGRGIRKDALERIFERFYSIEDHGQPSTGIGLTLTKSLVELHHGQIDVESEPGQFTRFTIKLPLTPEKFAPDEVIHDFKDSEHVGHYQLVDPAPAEAPAAETGTIDKKDLSEWKKILIVEDNFEVRQYIKSLFNKKYIVLEAKDGQEGIDLAEEESPDVIISDVMMPALDGINMCKIIKSDVKTSHIPVILLTARTSLIYTVEGLEKGADDYITKPFNPRILELKVRNLIAASDRLKKIYADRETLDIEPKKVTLTSMDEKFIQNALESIERNMANSEYTIKDLGRDVGFSRMQLYRKLKALTGLSTNEFIRNIRMKRAAQLIEQDQLTIAEVTYEVGFTDLQYFRSCFKKQFGVNPSEYGKKQVIDEQE